MGQTLPGVPVEDLRARLDLDPAYASDALLQTYIGIAERIVGAELAPEEDYRTHPNVAEAIAQIAVKVWDMRPRGVQPVDLDAAFADAPALPATRGLVLSVRGLLLPSMPTGGLTV